MMWHPLSDDHVVLLSSDGRLSLFDVAADPQYPEQARPPGLRLEIDPSRGRSRSRVHSIKNVLVLGFRI